ncbi:FAD-dependent oxidoreductase [Hyphomicrobiales bacterium]|mgnify:FL=1|jgi:succinate dehydrogenase/fumarate reductase flavoprotein subunit|nr:FAD-dependent oxidoreductase [Hyphomicrobiales bacterium]
MKKEFDIVVLGAGASGMMAALSAHENGSSVGIFEKQSLIGGTAGISGGIIWAPMNSHMKKAGIDDDRSKSIEYFMSLSQGDINQPLLEAFIDNCGEALDFLEEKTDAKFSILDGYPDYYLDRPGALKGGGRALDNHLFDFSILGDWASKVRNNGMPLPLTLAETPLGGGTGVIPDDIMSERLEKDSRGFGQALVGALLKGCLDRGIEPYLDTKAKKLIKNDERITGIEIEKNGQTETIIARRGVIIATGGFEWNKDFVTTFLRGPLRSPASPPGNDGDGLMMAQEAGASLGNMTSAWWSPVLSIPGDNWPEGGQKSSPILIERTLPHSLMVNKSGKRFCNEATNYSALAGAFHFFDPNKYGYPNLPAWIVFDSTYRDKYPFANIMPGSENPSWMKTSPTLDGLANELDIDSENLVSTIQNFNSFVEEGDDKEFFRGKSDYDSFYGDRSQSGVYSTLGKLEKAPFFAVEINIGALGTNGGARTDEYGRVISASGNIIEGLYTVGNAMAGSTGSVYAGAGGTLGPALTYGYLAGQHAAGNNYIKGKS